MAWRLIGTAIYVGVTGDFDVERMSLGQALLLNGVVTLTWAWPPASPAASIFEVAVPGPLPPTPMPAKSAGFFGIEARTPGYSTALQVQAITASLSTKVRAFE